MRWSPIVLALCVACAAPPPPHYTFVMPQPSAVPRPAPGDQTSSVVYVLGEIQAPGRVRFHAGLTVIGAIVDSGGLTVLAAPRVVVKRTVGGKQSRFVVSISAIQAGEERDLPLQAGDEIFVEGRYV